MALHRPIPDDLRGDLLCAANAAEVAASHCVDDSARPDLRYWPAPAPLRLSLRVCSWFLLRLAVRYSGQRA